MIKNLLLKVHGESYGDRVILNMGWIILRDVWY